MIIDNKLYCKYNLNMKKEYDLSTMKSRPNPYMKTNTLSDFDIADYLDSKEAIAEYLSQVLADGDVNELLVALGHIARAKGMTEVAKKTGLVRESLYKTFQEGTKPKFETIVKVLDAFGVRLKAV